MANIFGRQVVLPMVNKSGGALALGDVVIVDASNDTAVTTTTSAASTVAVGVVQETIASNATGRVLFGGYTSLVNVAASVTRGQHGTTHTVAKQATSTANRGAGTFCKFLTGGTTPAAYVFPTDLLGTSLTNPMSAVGDIIQGTTAGAPAALAAGASGKVLQAAGATTSVAWKYPPGYEFDYVEITSPVSFTATSAATADTCITGNSVAYDGSTIIKVEFYAPYITSVAASAAGWLVELYDGSTNIGALEQVTSQTSASILRMGASGSRRLTPSNASHTYSIRAWTTSAGTASFGAGAGGAGAYMPAYMRITKVSGGA